MTIISDPKAKERAILEAEQLMKISSFFIRYFAKEIKGEDLDMLARRISLIAARFAYECIRDKKTLEEIHYIKEDLGNK
jgi:hypothetical protein